LAACAVPQRTGEIAIRMALGARPAHVLAIAMRQFARPVAVGPLVGLGGAAALSRILPPSALRCERSGPGGRSGRHRALHRHRRSGFPFPCKAGPAGGSGTRSSQRYSESGPDLPHRVCRPVGTKRIACPSRKLAARGQAAV